MTHRYARQQAVPGVGRAGQERIRLAEASVLGDSLGAEICALYLAGAGVGRLHVDPPLVTACAALNSDIEVFPNPPGGVRKTGAFLATLDMTDGVAGVRRGAEEARRVLAEILTVERPECAT